MLGRVAALASKAMGPKTLIGVLSTLFLVLGLVVWRWQAAADEAAGAEERAVQYRQALVQAEGQLMAERQAQRALNEALAAQRQREEQARTRAKRAEAALQQLEESNEAVAEWSSTDLPGGITGWLRNDHGASDTDEVRPGGATD